MRFNSNLTKHGAGCSYFFACRGIRPSASRLAASVSGPSAEGSSWLRRSGRRRRRVAPSRPLPRQQSREVVDQREVEKYDPGGERPRVTREGYEFPGEIEAGGDDGKPLGPVFALPQPVAFREPNQRVSKAHSGDLALMMVGSPGHGFDEQPHVMPLRVDSVPQQERVGGRVKVCVPQGQQPAGSRQRQGTFGGLEDRNGTQTDWKSARQLVHQFQS